LNNKKAELSAAIAKMTARCAVHYLSSVPVRPISNIIETYIVRVGYEVLNVGMLKCFIDWVVCGRLG